MDQKVYDAMIPENPGLAFTAPLPSSRVSPTKVVDALMDMVGHDNIAALLVRLADGVMSSGDNQLPDFSRVPEGSLQSIAKFSKQCKTPEEFAYLCYRLGQHDQIRFGDPSMLRSMESARNLTHAQAQELYEKFKAAGDNSL